ncbi:phage tail protein [Streptomyces sp. NPDC093085]|uniref:phage tail protein n=1 Tax=Streptomyces sp. NPDC093085 TaxID=3155068 RepID=UPI00343531CA
MSMEQGDALLAHNFGIQIDGITVETLHSVSELGNQQDVIEYAQVTENGQPIVRKLPGVKKAGEVTIVRGAQPSPVFSEWLDTSVKGDMGSARKNASVVYMDSMKQPIKRVNLRNAWCSSRMVSGVTAGEASVVTETVVIVYEEAVPE